MSEELYTAWFRSIPPEGPVEMYDSIYYVLAKEIRVKWAPVLQIPVYQLHELLPAAMQQIGPEDDPTLVCSVLLYKAIASSLELFPLQQQLQVLVDNGADLTGRQGSVFFLYHLCCMALEGSHSWCDQRTTPLQMASLVRASIELLTSYGCSFDEQFPAFLTRPGEDADLVRYYVRRTWQLRNTSALEEAAERNHLGVIQLCQRHAFMYGRTLHALHVALQHKHFEAAVEVFKVVRPSVSGWIGDTTFVDLLHEFMENLDQLVHDTDNRAMLVQFFVRFVDAVPVDVRRGMPEDVYFQFIVVCKNMLTLVRTEEEDECRVGLIAMYYQLLEMAVEKQVVSNQEARGTFLRTAIRGHYVPAMRFWLSKGNSLVGFMLPPTDEDDENEWDVNWRIPETLVGVLQSTCA